MLYCSIDIETTGLDFDKNQVLEIGCVIDNTDRTKRKPIDKLDSKRIVIYHDELVGDPFAIDLNSKLIHDIVNSDIAVHKNRAGLELIQFLSCYFSKEVVVAGKNVSSFDIPFIKNLPDGNDIRFHRRSLDPTIFFIRPDDVVPPNLSECLRRIGESPSDLHTAVGDAIDVCKLIRHGFDNQGKI